MKPASPRGPWTARLLIRLFTVVFGVLIYWLLGFVVRDIESAPGPDFQAIQARHVDPAQLQQRQELSRQVGDLERRVANKREEQRLAGDSAASLQRTITQLVELQRLSLQKEIVMSEAERANLGTSLNRFLESQKSYQDLNQDITQLTTLKQQAEESKRQVEEGIEAKMGPARDEYGRAMDAHRFRLALWQLAILIPLLLVAGYFLVRQRGSVYFPVYLAFGGATLVKAAFVIHKYFPSRYLKYVLIAAVMAVVVRLLLHLIRTTAFPKAEWLIRQYREAYERFLCPVCDYPVRTGPRRHLFWTRRTVHKVLPQGAALVSDEPYTCPSCGTSLFETCAACHKTRHALLPHCEHCGAAKSVA